VSFLLGATAPDAGGHAERDEPERLAISRAFGARVMTVGDFHVNDAVATVAELGSRPGYFAPRQFDSE
jgi:cysteine synthase